MIYDNNDITFIFGCHKNALCHFMFLFFDIFFYLDSRILRLKPRRVQANTAQLIADVFYIVFFSHFKKAMVEENSFL